MAQFKVIIIGSGFGGQCTAIRLNQLGITDYVLLERRAFMGGTWAQNTYPGAAVDVQSPLYSIESEPYDWSQMFADQHELREYTAYVIEKHHLRDKTLTNSNVENIAWNAESKHWEVSVEGRGVLTAQFVVNASGPLSTPVIPPFKGRESFEGTSFHTNNWDQTFDYKNKRVAIIGSGASAAQVIPAIASDVTTLDVFQRTPHWVMPRPDYVFKPWQRALLRKKSLHHVLRSIIYWCLELRVLGFKYFTGLLDFIARRPAEAQMRKQIKDPVLRKKVTPDFTIGCKRIILSDTLYPAYCRDNVTLHDKTDGIAEINASGILTTQGTQVDVDLIVYSTGYDATDGVISYPVVGKNGKTLSTVWADFPRAYMGTMVPDFPNLFIVTGPNTGIGHTSAVVIIEAQLNYIMSAITSVLAMGKTTIEPTVSAEEQYTTLIHKEMAKTVWQKGGCSSWYKSKSGKVIAMFPGFSFTYRRWTKKIRKNDHTFA